MCLTLKQFFLIVLLFYLSLSNLCAITNDFTHTKALFLVKIILNYMVLSQVIYCCYVSCLVLFIVLTLSYVLIKFCNVFEM